MEVIYKYYHKYYYDKADPRSSTYFLAGSPVPVTLILISYWLFIKKIGPAFMKNRPPYNIKPIIQVYNLFQVATNGILGVYGICLFIRTTDSHCVMHDTNSDAHLTFIWLTWAYYMLKLLDLLDTVFFVLRKKFHLITTLHTYHHTIMVISVVTSFRFYPGGEAVFMGLNNGIVHTIMYFYYFWCMHTNNRGVWWKKYITRLQLFQFFLNLVWFTAKLIIGNCEYSRLIIIFIIVQNLVMIKMFSAFYYNAFIKPKPKDVKTNGVTKKLL